MQDIKENSRNMSYILSTDLYSNPRTRAERILSLEVTETKRERRRPAESRA